MSTPAEKSPGPDPDRRHIELEPEAWRVFLRALDNPPQPNARLKALMACKPPWEG